MKIALLGYGKMGRRIEEIASSRGHDIVLRLDETTENWGLDGVDVAIDFSSPEAAFHHIVRSLEAGVPVVCGTTGWLDRWDEVSAKCLSLDGAFLYASNFSLGVNLFFELNRKLAELMAGQSGYQPSLEEIHHIHKLDSPSGTAISLAEDLVDRHPGLERWYLRKEMGPKGETTYPVPHGKNLPIVSYREGEVPGTHRIRYESGVDRIEVTHEAFSRDGFALGAVVAAEWLPGKSGVFSMKDVLSL